MLKEERRIWQKSLAGFFKYLAYLYVDFFDWFNLRDSTFIHHRLCPENLGEICVTPMLFSLSFLPEITTMSGQATDPLASLLTSIRSELKNADMLGSYAERTIDFFNAVM